jgi:3-hydroxymyristoyl/3-hydroxydecanoyl-(acyl carrier protein) dehydratase
MDGHFRAFSFVDRITSVQPGIRVRGTYQIPAGISSFPIALAVEAVGQLAAWSAMAALEFKMRPVAGIAAAVDLFTPPQPGRTMDLAVEIETVDNDAVAYGGTAHIDGIPIVRLNHCVGPMLPQEDFDDLNAVKNRYALLCDGGATPGAFGGVPSLPLERTGSEPGQWIRANLPVPLTAPFFEDHFARRPVFPGTLFMDKVLELAADIAKDIPLPKDAVIWKAHVVTDGKMRVFIPPGDCLEFEAKLTKRGTESIVIFVETRKAKRVTGSSRIHLVAEKAS